MKKRILLTSFDIWLKDQQSNSSDDLLLEVTKLELIPHDLIFLRHLPVDVQLASERVIQKINAIQPDYIIITSYTREVSSHKALNAGFNRFLVKLESPEEIVDEIVHLLSTDL